VPFMAPEMLRGKALDGRVDVYSLGVTAYWLLTGKRPFSGATDLLVMQSILGDTPKEPIELNAGVPLELNNLVMRMLEKDPSQRISSAREVARELEDVLVSRRAIVIPFVRTIFDLPQRVNPDEPISQTSGFLPSTPHTDTLKMGRVLIHPPLGPNDERMAVEVSGSGPRRLPPTAQELATVGRSSTAPRGADLMHALDDATAGELALAISEDRPARTEDALAAPLQPQPTGPWPQPTDPLASPYEVAPPRGIPRPVLLGVAAGLACVVLVAAVVMSRSTDPPMPTAPDAGDVAIDTTAPIGSETNPLTSGSNADAGQAADPVTEPDAGVPAVVAEVSQPVSDPVDNTKQRTRSRREPPAKQAVTVKAPPEVQWLAEGRGVGSGSGTVQVPAGASKLVAWDKKRGVKTTVPLGSGSIDYSKLPRGKIQPRVKPFAEVFLGQVSIGTTPFAAVDVVAGTYTVRFVYKDKEQVKSIEIPAGGVVRPLVDFTAQP
jgi:Protein kinase domain